jgi:hypothetical protein
MRFRIWLEAGLLYILCLAALLLASCAQHMEEQPRYEPYDESSFFPDSLSARPLPEGVVPRGSDSVTPPPVTLTMLRRGRVAFDTYCAPCHGFTGEGDGIVALRGLRTRPPTLHSSELRGADPTQLYEVIRDGVGAMPPYGFQVRVQDRWAIAAYVRALQWSQWAVPEDVPAEQRQLLNGREP